MLQPTPEAIANPQLKHPQLAFGSMFDALDGADIVAVVTECKEYRSWTPSSEGLPSTAQSWLTGATARIPPHGEGLAGSTSASGGAEAAEARWIRRG